MNQPNRYVQILERIFDDKYQKGSSSVEFRREDLEQAATELGIKLPKNLGDILYSFRYRVALPELIQREAPEGQEWLIQPAGRALYRLILAPIRNIAPNPLLAETKIPDATPGIITKYALDDEQGLLAKLRYNRLIDIFTGVTCYSLQNHLRTTVPNIGQVETDELYVGVDKRGVHYVFPVQAKGGKDKLGMVQIEQDYALCQHRFSSLLCRPVAAQFMADGLIALFDFEQTPEGLAMASEKHYRLVSPDSVTEADISLYRQRQ